MTRSWKARLRSCSSSSASSRSCRPSAKWVSTKSICRRQSSFIGSVNQGHGQVVADDYGEEDGVEAVEDAAVGAEDGAGVLGAEVALKHRLEEVADRGEGGDGGADQEGIYSGEPVLVE